MKPKHSPRQAPGNHRQGLGLLSGQAPPLPLTREFLADALANPEDLIRFHLLIQALDHGARSLREIARQLHDAPRRGSPLPGYVDAGLVLAVGRKLDTKRLSIANLRVSNLFGKHVGTGALLAAEREGLGFDRVTEDGRRVADTVAYLIHHWVDAVLAGASS